MSHAKEDNFFSITIVHCTVCIVLYNCTIQGVCQSDTCHNNTVICNCISHKKVYALQQEHTISMRFDEPITSSLLQKNFPSIYVKT